jgi:hypothetical protein
MPLPVILFLSKISLFREKKPLFYLAGNLPLTP